MFATIENIAVYQLINNHLIMPNMHTKFYTTWSGRFGGFWQTRSFIHILNIICSYFRLPPKTKLINLDCVNTICYDLYVLLI